jgi:hypothetical protein
MHIIESERRRAIEEIYEDWDFDGRTVVDASGWLSDGLGRFSRPVFLAPEYGDGDSVKVEFTVQFAPGSARSHQVEVTWPVEVEALAP